MEGRTVSPELMDVSTPLFSHDPVSCPKHLDLQLFLRFQLLSSFLICFISKGHQKPYIKHEKTLGL